MALLFTLQALLGGATQHYRAEIANFSVLISPDSCPLIFRARGIFSLRFSGSPLHFLLRVSSLLP
jgi:hypothetical protein